MSLIKPFCGLRPAPGRASDVLAPPYDVLSSQEARVRARGRPWSFLHISKPEIDLPEDISVYDDAVYAKAAENLQKMREEGVLLRDPVPHFYIYRLKWRGHVQTGIVAVASVAAYDQNRIRKHEFTRPVKEDDRVRQIEAVGAQTGPVMLAYPRAPHIDEMIRQGASGTPEFEVKADDGITHTLWVVEDEALMGELEKAFDGLEALYIADGHHRSAAASRVCARRRQKGGAGDSMACYFLSVIFPYGEMKILDYNRVIRDLNGHTPQSLLERIGEVFAVAAEQGPARPGTHGEFGMYLDGQWYRLRLDEELVPADPVGRLDVSLLADNLIAPLLGITDPRTDERIDFVGGMRGLEELARRVDSGEMAVAFALYPTPMEALLAVADAGGVMPPKSTWFEPKLADGVVSHLLD